MSRISSSAAWRFLLVATMGLVAVAAATMSTGTYPGLLLGLAVVAAVVIYTFSLSSSGTNGRATKTAWFTAILVGFATVIAFIDHAVSNTQMGVLITYLMGLTLLAIVVAVGMSVADRFHARRHGGST